MDRTSEWALDLLPSLGGWLKRKCEVGWLPNLVFASGLHSHGPGGHKELQGVPTLNSPYLEIHDILMLLVLLLSLQLGLCGKREGDSKGPKRVCLTTLQ